MTDDPKPPIVENTRNGRPPWLVTLDMRLVVGIGCAVAALYGAWQLGLWSLQRALDGEIKSTLIEAGEYQAEQIAEIKRQAAADRQQAEQFAGIALQALADIQGAIGELDCQCRECPQRPGRPQHDPLPPAPEVELPLPPGLVPYTPPSKPSRPKPPASSDASRPVQPGPGATPLPGPGSVPWEPSTSTPKLAPQPRTYQGPGGGTWSNFK